MIKVSIHGSCVSRDIFRFDIKNEYEVVNYIGRNSIISLSCPPFNLQTFEKIKDGRELGWEQRMIYLDSKKAALDKILADGCDYLIIDLIDERFGIVESNKGYLTYSQVLQRSECINELIPYTVKAVNENSQEFFNAYKEYALRLRKNFEINRIIIHEAYPVSLYLGTDNNLHVFDAKDIEKSKELCSRIEKGYKLLEMFLPEAEVIRMPYDTVAYEGHKWGKAAVHYVDKYYIDALAKIRDIINGKRYLYANEAEVDKGPLKNLCNNSIKILDKKRAVYNKFQNGFKFKCVDSNFQYVKILEKLDKGMIYKIDITIKENFIPYELAVYDFLKKIFVYKYQINNSEVELILMFNYTDPQDCALLLYNGMIGDTNHNCMLVEKVYISIIYS